MSAFAIGSLTSYLQPIVGSAIQRAGSVASSILGGVTSSSSSSSPVTQADSGGLSPFAQIMSELQQLQQSNPAQYKQVTQQIATNLQSAAQTAQADGNTTAATQLNQIASDFSSASQSGQLPNMQDLAQAVGGGHHHHHFHGAQSGSDSQGLNQLLSALQTTATQNEATNPTAIILNTLSSAGISQ